MYLHPPLPSELEIHVSVRSNAATDYLVLSELLQPRRLPRFSTLSGRLDKDSVAEHSIAATAERRLLGETGISEQETGWTAFRLSRKPSFILGLQDYAPPPPPPPLPPESGADYTVWFGTNRQPVLWEHQVIDFSADRDEHINYGQCRVTIPESHRIGSVGSSWIKRLLARTDDRVSVRAIRSMNAELYWSELTASLAEIPLEERDAVVFLHGYNVSFKSAAIRAAQLGFDLGISGAMAFFSWPSHGTVAGYAADEASIEASEGFIEEYLTNIATKSGSSKVHIIAHSMGNRGLLRAIDRIASNASNRTGVPFGQIVLAAADVDSDTFKRLAIAYQRVAERTTMYVCSKDVAVGTSYWLHDYPRAGLMPPVLVVSGIDTVNVTNVDPTSLGHGYVAAARELLSDIHQLIREGTPPEKRFGLRKMATADGSDYWIVGT